MSQFTLSDAHALARHAHAGQVDLQGRDYYTHHLLPIAESLNPLGEHAVMAGLLHDILEDCADRYDAARLSALNVPEPVVRAVVSVTRQPAETYAALISRSCADPLGVHIKLADNEHNITSIPGLAALDQPKATSLLAKRYLPARDRLVEARLRHRLGLLVEQEG